MTVNNFTGIPLLSFLPAADYVICKVFLKALTASGVCHPMACLAYVLMLAIIGQVPSSVWVQIKKLHHAQFLEKEPHLKARMHVHIWKTEITLYLNSMDFENPQCLTVVNM